MADEQDTPSDAILPALRDLVQSEGWRLLCEQVKREWGPQGYGRRMQEAISTVPNGPERAYELARVAEEVDATAKAVNQVMAWPENQIRELTPKRAPRAFESLRRITR
jgi:hypothetical protein